MNTKIVNEEFSKLKNCLPVRESLLQRLAVAVYEELSIGRPVTVAALESKLDVSKNRLQEKIEELPGIYKNDDGAIIGFWGLTISYNSPHKLIVNGIASNTWCAWDALFIPGIIRATAEVELTCPVTDHITKLKVGPEEMTEVSNPDAVISFLMPDEFDENIISDFCHYIYGFKNIEVFKQWQSDGHGQCFSLSLQEAFELGRLKNNYQFGEVLGGF